MIQSEFFTHKEECQLSRVMPNEYCTSSYATKFACMGFWNMELGTYVFEGLYSPKSRKKKELGIAQPRYLTGRRDSSMVSRKAST